MAKGFTKDGKFRPTGNNTRTSSREKSIQPDGSTLKILKFKVWKYDDAPEDVQEKILEKLRLNKSEFGDTFFAENEFLIYDEEKKKDGHDIGLKNLFPKYYDVGSGHGTDYVQFELEIEDETKFAKYLGINKELQNKIDFRFENDNTRHDPDSTTLEIISEGIVIDTNTSHDEILTSQEKFGLSQSEFNKIFDAIIKFDNLIGNAVVRLSNEYEDQFTDETLAEDARANDYDFDEDGRIA